MEELVVSSLFSVSNDYGIKVHPPLNRKMSIDAEITKINEGIAKVHLALFKFDNQLNGILQSLNGNLGDFDNGVENAVGKVNGVSQDVINVFTYFPDGAVYYSVLVTLLVLLNISCLYMVYYIYRWIVERDLRLDKELRRYRKKVYRLIDDNRMTTSLENIETPPPTYDEYVRT
ncbi:hypothetical protein OSTOST_03838 [Ostertagia ostertagi]